MIVPLIAHLRNASREATWHQRSPSRAPSRVKSHAVESPDRRSNGINKMTPRFREAAMRVAPYVAAAAVGMGVVLALEMTALAEDLPISVSAHLPHRLAGTWTMTPPSWDTMGCSLELRIDDEGKSIRLSDGKSVFDDRLEMPDEPDHAGLYPQILHPVSGSGGGGCLGAQATSGTDTRSYVLPVADDMIMDCPDESEIERCTGPFRRDVSSLARERRLARPTFAQRLSPAVLEVFARLDPRAAIGVAFAANPVFMNSGTTTVAFPCERVAAFQILPSQAQVPDDWRIAECRDVAGLRRAWAPFFDAATSFYNGVNNDQKRAPGPELFKPLHRKTEDGSETWVATSVLIGHGPVGWTSGVFIDATGQRAFVIQTAALNTCLQRPEIPWCPNLDKQIARVAEVVARVNP